MEGNLHTVAHLLVIGGASLDTLHLKNQTVCSAGGAGMYTTMAARRSGVNASMFAPKPDPMPEELYRVSGRLCQWLGPLVPPDCLPHFEIQHDGDKATYIEMFIGAEGELSTDQLPVDLGAYDCVHLTPLGNSGLQQKFIRSCLKKGAKTISAGTYLCTIKENPELIKTTIGLSDIFFMNEEEATLLFGALENVKTDTGKIIFITLGAKGALVVQGGHQTQLQTKKVAALDPTGAGDTFCGAALAQLMLGSHPVMAAHKAMALAAREIEEIGPAALLREEPAPEAPLDERIRLNHEQIAKISEVVKSLDAASPSSFIGKDFPPADHPATLDYFFATILQQFSFWDTLDGRYDHPLIETLDGDKLKGSAYLFRAYLRPLKEEIAFYTPKRQADLSQGEMARLFRADNGSDPMPAFDLHLEMANHYGRDMLATGNTPQLILEKAQKSGTPSRTFLHELDQISGYKEDPLRKKSNLLALVLNQRPEGFLTFGKDENVPPVIDYHTMRACLRMGLIDVLDKEVKKTIAGRKIVTADEEWAVRYACYLAVEEVVRISGKGLGAVDWFFFNYSRQHCPEMSDPVCVECAVNAVCKHRKELFQPVLRTTFY